MRIVGTAVSGFAAALLLLASGPLAAQGKAAAAEAGEPIVVGRSYTLRSTVLGDTRRLNVWLPDSYGTGDRRYSVLMLLDGGAKEDFLHIAGLAQVTAAYGHGREMIVVGIEGVDRRHDLSAPTDDPEDLTVTKKPGGADAYRRFLIEEVKPWIAAHYRTDGRTALIGESMAGHFVLDTLASTPAAFNDYLAVSPILWWNRQALSRRLAANPPATGPDRRVFIAYEGGLKRGPNGPSDLEQARMRVDATLGGKPDVTILHLDAERHDSIYHPAALAAFRTLYAITPAH